MMRQVEEESAGQGNIAVICDFRSSNPGVYPFLQKSGYIEVARVLLYDSREEDIVMAKPLKPGSPAAILRTRALFT